MGQKDLWRGKYSVFDLHLHTVKGSSDSSLSPEELVQEARQIGLQGVCLTEHSGWYNRQELAEFARQEGLLVIRGLEVATEVGHVLVFGLDGYLPGVTGIRELRRVVVETGGYMVLAHPYRNLLIPQNYNRGNAHGGSVHLGSRPEEAASHPAFGLVDEVEVVNGATAESENRFALEVARRLGRRGTGGSDAHSRHGIGKGITVFHGALRDEEDFMEALRAGAFTPGEDFNLGEPLLFGPLPRHERAGLEE